MVKFSAYLSIYNDWDLLAPSLLSMRDHIDELVVVDGAYEWMVPFLSKLGLDPTQSKTELYDVLSGSGIPTTVLKGPWKDELSKRKAGYAACKGRYVYRVDADEVVFMKQEGLEKFLSTESAVAEMEVPLMDTPDFIQVIDSHEHLPRVGFLFDTTQISTEDHLRYLWIVHGPEGLPGSDRVLPPVASEAAAFTAHLTTWRMPDAATQRSAFYVMNWVRGEGFPWISTLRGKPLDDLSEIFKYMPADFLLSALSRNDIANGHFKNTGDAMRSSPLTQKQRDDLRPLYARRLEASFAMNEEAKKTPQGFLAGNAICFNITGDTGRKSLLDRDKLRIKTSVPIGGAQAHVHTVNSESPYTSAHTLPVSVSDQSIEIDVPGDIELDKSLMRRVLSVSIWPESSSTFGSFTII